MILTLEEIKRQVSAVDYDDDDELLVELASAAESEVCAICGRNLNEFMDMNGGNFPLDVKRAMLIRTSELYANREGSEKVNHTFSSILTKWIKV